MTEADRLLELAAGQRDELWNEAHSDVACAIAERFICQPRDMTWEDRSDELATAALHAMQIFISLHRTRAQGDKS